MEKIFEFNEARFFKRDNGQKDVVGIAGILPLNKEIKEGHYIVDMRNVEKGNMLLVYSDELNNIFFENDFNDTPYTSMCLSEMARSQFVNLDTDEKLAHVYARPVYSDQENKNKAIAFIGCMKKEAAIDFPNEQTLVVSNGEFFEGKKVPMGEHIFHALKTDGFRMSNGDTIYSGNNTGVDDKRRSMYIELASMGSGSSREERIELLDKYFPDERISHVFDDDFVDYLTATMVDNKSPKEAVKNVIEKENGKREKKFNDVGMSF